jgi:cytochrome c-type biogenesis protein CcmH/NrfG
VPLDAVDAFNIRPEPFIVLGYCDMRLGRPALAVRAMQSAVRKDPENWEGH